MTQTTKKVTQTSKTTIITPEFRVSFPWMFQPQPPKKNADGTDSGKAKYGIAMVWRTKADPANPATAKDKVVDLQPVKEAIMAAIVKQFGPEQTKWPKGIIFPLRDGATVTDDQGKAKAGYGPGTIFASARSEMKPDLLDYKKDHIESPSEFYAGCYAYALIGVYVTKKGGPWRVCFGLNGVQKSRDGEPLSNRARAEDEFDALPGPETDSPAGEDAFFTGKTKATTTAAPADPMKDLGLPF